MPCFSISQKPSISQVSRISVLVQRHLLPGKFSITHWKKGKGCGTVVVTVLRSISSWRSCGWMKLTNFFYISGMKVLDYLIRWDYISTWGWQWIFVLARLIRSPFEVPIPQWLLNPFRSFANGHKKSLDEHSTELIIWDSVLLIHWYNKLLIRGIILPTKKVYSRIRE